MKETVEVTQNEFRWGPIIVQATGWVIVLVLAYLTSADVVQGWVYWTALAVFAASVAAWDVWTYHLWNARRNVKDALRDVRK